MLGVSPNTLRSWERRYGYPGAEAHRRQPPQLRAGRAADPARRPRRDRQHLLGDRAGPPAPGGAGHDGDLLAAFESFDEAAADRAIEESLALRPLERTVEELLLPAIDELAADPEREAELEFAARWATGWLHGARRLASAASRPAGILLLDSSRGQDAEAVHTQALDLALRRAGFRVLMLSNELGDERLERALGALDPTAIVLCGPGAEPPDAVRLVRKIRELGFDAPLYGFRAAAPRRGRRGSPRPARPPARSPACSTRTCAAAPRRPSPSRAPSRAAAQLAGLGEQPAVGAPELAVLIEEAVPGEAGAEDAQVPVVRLAARRRQRRAEVDRQIEGRRGVGHGRGR